MLSSKLTDTRPDCDPQNSTRWYWCHVSGVMKDWQTTYRIPICVLYSLKMFCGISSIVTMILYEVAAW